MRYLRYLILLVLAVVLITVALANRDPMTIRLLPAQLSGLFGFSWQVTLPAFLILLTAVAFGVLLGFIWEWMREHKHRAEASRQRRRSAELERSLKDAKPAKKPGDDVLELLEGR